MTIDQPAADLLEPIRSLGIVTARDWDDLAARINAAINQARCEGEAWGRERFRDHLVMLVEESGHCAVSTEFIKKFKWDLS